MDFIKRVLNKSCPAIVEGLDGSSTREILDAFKGEDAFGNDTLVIVRDLEDTFKNKNTSDCLRGICDACGRDPSCFNKFKYILTKTGHADLLEILEHNEAFIRDRCKDVQYRVSNIDITKHNIKIPSDTNTCYIDGLCQMSTGELIVSDAANKTIKRLDATFKVTDYCNVTDRPNAICNVCETDIVVAMETDGLQFINIGDKMKKTKILDLFHESFGVAFLNDQLFVSDKQKKIYIHSMSGELLRVIQRDNSGVDLFSGTRHLAISSDEDKLFVADREKGLVVLKTDGTLLNIVTTPELQGTRGVTLDIFGNVFLVGCLSHNIAQIDSTGERVLGVVADKRLFYPGAVLVDANRSSLVVTSSPSKGGNFLDVRQLEHAKNTENIAQCEVETGI